MNKPKLVVTFMIVLIILLPICNAQILEIEDISGSPTGQQIKSDYEDIKERVRTGEMETKVRDELVSALRIINKEIEKVSSKWAPPSPTADEDDSESKDTEVSS